MDNEYTVSSCIHSYAHAFPSYRWMDVFISKTIN